MKNNEPSVIKGLLFHVEGLADFIEQIDPPDVSAGVVLYGLGEYLYNILTNCANDEESMYSEHYDGLLDLLSPYPELTNMFAHDNILATLVDKIGNVIVVFNDDRYKS